jgi:uncharacterized protein (DUF4415 family)
MSKRESEYNFNGAKQGAVVKALPGKIRITIRIDRDVLNWFRDQVHKAGGGNYQTLINEALREYVQHRDVALERALRKVIREELHGNVKEKRAGKRSSGGQSVYA